MPKKRSQRSLKWPIAVGVVLAAALAANLALDWISAVPGVKVREIRVYGELRNASARNIEAVARKAASGGFYTTKLTTVRDAVEKAPWVRSATVRRVWPDRLDIEVEEHRPFARWNGDSLLDAGGRVFRAEYAGALPRLAGPAGTEREVMEAYGRFSAILEPPRLAISDVALSPRRAWQVRLANGTVLDLGRGDAEARVRRFVAATGLIHGLAERRGAIDLRYSNGFAVKGEPMQPKTARRP